ncbi:MAG: SRPBCC family protein [Deltaproteobacteria bacterium]
MKYSIDITINRPINEVIETFKNPDEMKNWMKGLVSFEPLDDNFGNPGSKSLLVFQSGKRKLKMMETVLVNNLPHEFTASYKAKNVFNIVGNSFEEIGPEKTKYITNQEFKFTGLMKIAYFFMKPAFKKQSYKFLHDFKEYVEKNKK